MHVPITQGLSQTRKIICFCGRFSSQPYKMIVDRNIFRKPPYTRKEYNTCLSTKV